MRWSLVPRLFAHPQLDQRHLRAVRRWCRCSGADGIANAGHSGDEIVHADGSRRAILNVPGHVRGGQVWGDPVRAWTARPCSRWRCRVMADVCNETLAMANMTAADIDWLVPHRQRAHHRRHRQAPRHRAGEDHRHGQGQGKYLGGVDSHGARHRRSRQSHQTGAGGADGWRRWRIYTGSALIRW